MTCRHLPYERDVVVVLGRHVDPCASTWMPELNGTCLGCWPCDTAEPARHCSLCCRHLEVGDLQTCPECRGATRRCLLDVLELAALLPGHALRAAHDGRLLAAADIPGGDALVLMSRGSEGLDDQAPDEYLPPSFVLAWWEEQIREHRGDPSEHPAWQQRPAYTLTRAFGYLNQRFDWIASNYPGFHAFARDLKRTRTQLEDLLHAGDQPAEGVPCFLCGATLTRTYRDPRRCSCGPRPQPTHDHGNTGNGRPDRCCLGCARIIRWELEHEAHDQGGDAAEGEFDGWSCPRCRRTYDPGEYQLAVSVIHSEHAPALPATELAERLGLQPATIWQWARRGHIQRKGRAADGRTLYDVRDTMRHANSNSTAGDDSEGVS